MEKNPRQVIADMQSTVPKYQEAALRFADKMIEALNDAGWKIVPMLSEEIIRRDRSSWDKRSGQT